jgi:hypothetical protein
MLAHAEIEAFLEDLGFEKAKSVVDDWRRTKRTTDALFCLVAHYHSGFEVADEEGLPPKFEVSSRKRVKDQIEEVADRALNQYGAIVSQNHGVREENLLRIILPIGIRRSDLDPTWVTDLQEFGKRRGTVAHKAVSAHRNIDPQQEWSDVKKLLEGLKKLDGLVLASL